MRLALSVAAVALAALSVGAQSPDARRSAIVARGKSLALPGAWSPPPGIAIDHHTAGFAKTLCSAVFITGLDATDAAANVGFFTGPLKHRSAVVDTVVDRSRQEVRLRLSSGVTRVARRFKSQGCVALPIGRDSVFFAPSTVTPRLPDAKATEWPMGDLLPTAAWPRGVDSAAVAAALDTAFGPPDAMTLAVVVTHKGRLLGERYAPGVGIHTPLESWSMGKSVTGTLMARLMMKGVYTLEQPAPVPEWSDPRDPRRAIRIMDIMRMSSGLMLRGPFDPDYDESIGYSDHLYLYTGTVDSYRFAATRPQEWKPNTVGRYRNTDPVLASYLVRLGVERKLGQDYHSWPQRELFDKLGMRDAILETDPYGNFLGQGYEMIAARDWARLGNLYLQDGVWNGERLLPQGYVKHVRTLAPAWVADGNPVYGGGFFWINGDGASPIPKDAFSMQGAGGQSVTMIPSHDLVVVRIGKYRGAAEGDRALEKAFPMLLSATKR